MLHFLLILLLHFFYILRFIFHQLTSRNQSQHQWLNHVLHTRPVCPPEDSQSSCLPQTPPKMYHNLTDCFRDLTNYISGLGTKQYSRMKGKCYVVKSNDFMLSSYEYRVHVVKNRCHIYERNYFYWLIKAKNHMEESNKQWSWWWKESLHRVWHQTAPHVMKTWRALGDNGGPGHRGGGRGGGPVVETLWEGRGKGWIIVSGKHEVVIIIHDFFFWEKLSSQQVEDKHSIGWIRLQVLCWHQLRLRRLR